MYYSDYFKVYLDDLHLGSVAFPRCLMRLTHPHHTAVK